MDDAERMVNRFYEAVKTKKVVIFGTGTSADIFINLMAWIEGLNQDNIAFFCDNDKNKWGTTFRGKNVLPPTALLENDAVVIVASQFYSEIKPQLDDMSIENVFPGYLIGGLIGVDTSLAVSIARAHRENEDKLKEVRSYFSDEKSIHVFDSFIDRFKTGSYSYLEFIDDSDEMYFDRNVFSFCDNEVFIDGGSFDGKDTVQFLQMQGLNKAYCFEPDKRNFENLLKLNIEKLALKDIIELVPCCLYSETCTLKFNGAYLTASSAICANGSVDVRAVDLDSFMDGREPVTFIKLDVEGSELAALKGARRIITEQKPKLAICVYHKIADLWEIPLYIKSLVPEYSVYMRDYHSDIWYKVMLFTI